MHTSSHMTGSWLINENNKWYMQYMYAVQLYTAETCKLQAASCELRGYVHAFSFAILPFSVVRLCADRRSQMRRLVFFYFYTHTRAHQQPAGTSTHHTPAAHSSTM